MTNANSIHAVLIVDRSGSMAPLRKAVVEGFNTFLDTQRKSGLSCTVSTCWFGDTVDQLYIGRPLDQVHNLVDGDYQPSGGTPMNDAICQMIDAVGLHLSQQDEKDRPGVVSVLIVTDGEENTSRLFKTEDVRARINHQRDRYNWQFSFIGAGADAVTAGKNIGIDLRMCASFSAQAHTTVNAFMNYGNSTLRCASAVGNGIQDLTAAAAYSTAERASMESTNG